MVKKKSLHHTPFKLFIVLSAVLLFSVPAPCDEPKESKAFNLDEIVVTGTKTPHQLKDVPVQTVVITEEDIKDSSAQSVSDLLRSVPGFYTVSEDIPGVTSWRSKLRGLDLNSGYGLVLIDGMRVKGGGMGEYGVGVNQVPLSMIERIEVIKGAGSVLYGSDALVGVVNVITKPCPENAVHGIELAGGSQDTKIASAYSGTSHGPLGLFLNASINEADVGAYGYRSSRDEEYSSKRIDSKLSYAFNEKLSAKLGLSAEDEDRKRVYQTKDVTRNEWSEKYRIAPEVTFSPDEDATASISGYHYVWQMDEVESGEDSSGFTPTVGDMVYNNVEARYTRRFKDLFQLTAGGEYLQEVLDYNMADETVDTMSGYIQAEIGKLKHFTFVLGSRFDDHSAYGSYFSPKLSVMYEPVSNTKIRGSVGKGFKSPTIRQLYYTDLYQHGDYWYQSNPDLEAETSLGYSLGIEQMIGSRLLFDLTLFRNDIEDKILNVDTGEYEDGLPIVSYENVSEATTQGVELGVKALLTKDLTGTLTYTYTETEDKDSGNELRYVPNHDITGELEYTFSPLDLTLTADIEYAGEMYTDSENTEKADNYTLVDAKISKKFKEIYTLSVEGNNLTDTDYGQPDRDWLGRTFLVRFKIDI